MSNKNTYQDTLQHYLELAAEEALPPDEELTFRAMFGGGGAYARGRMFASLSNAGLALKLSPEDRTRLLERNRDAQMLQYEEGGPASKTSVVVPSEIMTEPSLLAPWVIKSVEYAASLPPPKKKRKGLRLTAEASHSVGSVADNQSERNEMPKTSSHASSSIASGAERQREAVARLREIPNVGPKIAALLIKLGITHLDDAAGLDPDEMYHELCTLEASRYDPCVRDVFAAVVSYAEGGSARPWWEFTPARKEREAKERQAREKAAREEAR